MSVEFMVDGVNICIQDTDVVHIASGAIVPMGLSRLNQAASILAMTLADPGEAGRTLLIVQSDTGTQGHTVTAATGLAFDGTNNRATFNAKREALLLYSISSTEWIILANLGGVVLTAV